MDSKEALEIIRTGITNTQTRIKMVGRKHSLSFEDQQNAHNQDTASILNFPLRSFRGSPDYRTIHHLYFEWDELHAQEKAILDEVFGRE
jgi:hypothetical protein